MAYLRQTISLLAQLPGMQQLMQASPQSQPLCGPEQPDAARPATQHPHQALPDASTSIEPQSLEQAEAHLASQGPSTAASTQDAGAEASPSSASDAEASSCEAEEHLASSALSDGGQAIGVAEFVPSSPETGSSAGSRQRAGASEQAELKIPDSAASSDPPQAGSGVSEGQQLDAAESVAASLSGLADGSRPLGLGPQQCQDDPEAGPQVADQMPPVTTCQPWLLALEEAAAVR